jgi:nitrogenase molybdenum-iron protein alpha/beta subunit
MKVGYAIRKIECPGHEHIHCRDGKKIVKFQRHASPYSFVPKRPFGFTNMTTSMMTNAMAFDHEPEI